MRVGVININIPLGTSVFTFSISVFNTTWDRVVLSPLKVGPKIISNPMQLIPSVDISRMRKTLATKSKGIRVVATLLAILVADVTGQGVGGCDSSVTNADR